jgi:type IV pilus assembly protein PilY1
MKSMTTAGLGSGTTPLLIFGGGYDTCEDGDPNTCSSSSNKGHYVYVVRADTGAVVKTFDTADSLPAGGTNLYRGIIADVTLVKNSSGNAILGYTADLGGNVYRIKFGDGTSDSDNSTTWTMTRIAQLGCDNGSTTCTANRKFMFAPSVVTTDAISLSATYHLLLGSGDREKPVKEYTSSYGVTNYFFQLVDKPGEAYPDSTSCSNRGVLCLSSLFGPITGASPTTDQLAAYNGWYLGLAEHEQVVTSAVTIFGNTTFSTHIPSTGSATCKSNLGDTSVFNIGFTNAAATGSTRFEDVSGDGLPPSPVAGQVTLDDGSTVPFCVGCSSSSPLQAKLPTSTSGATQAKGRLYWYLQK